MICTHIFIDICLLKDVDAYFDASESLNCVHSSLELAIETLNSEFCECLNIN